MKITRKLLSALIVLSIVFSFSACLLIPGTGTQGETEVTEKEEILTAVKETLKNDTYGYGYVYPYLVKWGITGFDTQKFFNYEYIFDSKYNFADGLPAPLTHAADTVKYFIENYYDTIDLKDSEKLTDALLYSYVYTVGDKYAFYRTAEEFEEYDEEMSGKFGGIGIQVEYDHTNRTILINQVFEDGPAAESGLKVGDYIIGVDGKTLDELGGYQNAISFVRGEEGTDVTVTVDRNGEILDITVTRALIDETSVSYALIDGKYGYIRISSFKLNTAEQFREAVEALEDLGVIGYIFDLRSNPGGYVHTAVEMVSYIIPSNKKVISYQYKGQSVESYRTSTDTLPLDEGLYGDHVIDLPMVIICDEYSASSSEIFIAALRDYDGPAEDIIDLTIVGQTTYGKGIMQGSVNYEVDNSYVTLTIAYYNPPSDVNYHGIGIAPDVEVDLGETEDTQLKEAIEQMDLLLQRL
jgi:carboxyl-terminal processing protease